MPLSHGLLPGGTQVLVYRVRRNRSGEGLSLESFMFCSILELKDSGEHLSAFHLAHKICLIPHHIAGDLNRDTSLGSDFAVTSAQVAFCWVLLG